MYIFRVAPFITTGSASGPAKVFRHRSFPFSTLTADVLALLSVVSSILAPFSFITLRAKIAIFRPVGSVSVPEILISCA